MEVKKDKNPETFSAQALGGGKFAIGFVEGAMPPAKPAKITLEIYLKGNHTDKPNATVPLTVNIVY